MSENRITIQGINFSKVSDTDIIGAFKSSISNGNRINILPFDFRHLLFSQKFERLKKSKDVLIYPDSSGMYFILRVFFRKYSHGFKRIISTNLHYEMLKVMNDYNTKLFLLGDTAQALTKFINKLNSEYPDITVNGRLEGFGNYTEEHIIEEINKHKCDVVMIGMGVPHQEIALINIENHIVAPVLVTVGAFISFYSRVVPRAPRFFQKYYLEWLYRLSKEPKRLFSRYFFVFPKVVFKIIKNKYYESRNSSAEY